MSPKPIATIHVDGSFVHVEWHDEVPNVCHMPVYGDPLDLEVRLNDDQSLDEIVGAGVFHLEQMDDNHWWLRLADGSGKVVTVHLFARGAIKARHEQEQER